MVTAHIGLQEPVKVTVEVKRERDMLVFRLDADIEVVKENLALLGFWAQVTVTLEGVPTDVRGRWLTPSGGKMGCTHTYNTDKNEVTVTLTNTVHADVLYPCKCVFKISRLAL